MTADRNGHQPSRHACPQCGQPVYKVHRSIVDRVVSVVRPVGRYRCRAEDCGWQGLLPRSPAAAWLPTDSARSRTAWIIAGVLAIPLIGLATAIYWLNGEDSTPMPDPPAPPAPSIATVPRESNEPREVEPGSVDEPSHGCVWGGPGESPYFGTVATALATAQLPDEIVRKFEIMRDGRFVTDRLEISSAGIRSTDHRRFFGHTTKAMAMGETVCLDTRIALPHDKTSAADLYELVDDRDRRFLVMIVEQGSNVAVLEESTERPSPRTPDPRASERKR